MQELTAFGGLLLLVSAAGAVAIASHVVTERLSLPAPALFLIAAAVASDLVPALALSPHDVERVGVVALIAILFDGGMQIGWTRARAAAVPIVSLGVAGTFLTAALVTCSAHALTGLSWSTAALVGAALAPTDPAVLFSVLGNREIGGRSDTILEGESGANDPVGISLMLAVITFVGADRSSAAGAAATFVLQLGVGAGVGVAGGLILRWLVRRQSLPSETLYPLRTLAAAGVIYGLASVAHGSGFLAVFVAGVLIGDTRGPYKLTVERFHATLAGIAEIVVFAVLGLTVSIRAVTSSGAWAEGFVLAAVLALLIRPAVVLPLLARVRLRRGEKLFVAWFGLKGAVPILLAAFAVQAGVDGAAHVYELVFVVVLVSVLVQGMTLTPVARALGVALRRVDQEPWDLAVRLSHRPRGVVRCVVADRSHVVGTRIRDLPLAEDTWISMIIRDGTVAQARGSTALEAGDELLVMTEADPASVRHLFAGTGEGM